MIAQRTPALFILADGFSLSGRSFAAVGTTLGQVKVSAATADHLTVAAHSPAGSVLVLGAPHAGITPSDTPESPELGAVVLREPSDEANGGPGEVERYMKEAGVIGICHLDTRALVRHLATTSAEQRAAIASGETLGGDHDEARAMLQDRLSQTGPTHPDTAGEGA